ncbi:ELM1/GtrOC1 family putative glycosyltransferase [Geminicoccaceae bacterium 1502E]|nr:ELM1/GtrOC1 family putative glycosyltransferase [Geminicoccaceae bacterium 1502E]
MPSEQQQSWPYHRENPDLVVLDVRPGVNPSGKPPVRIFLGTEDAQYRAERIFFFSVEKVRDPSRVYEIHLMKNVEGFDRRRWRTGFTNYRYAIPDFAGGHGKAIYNDVDQIYLADPALLFDLDMEGKGYLAISPKDTSVMLIDCERMLPMWNRQTASSQGKHALINKPASMPGLWGQLDPHWNARDQEYVEGRTMCLHYTALHQQPWQPFPDDYSYHPNPLAYLWHALERDADAAGYQVFTRELPSPDFRRILQGNHPVQPATASLSAGARALLDEKGGGRVLLVSAGPVSLAGLPDGAQVARLDLARDPDGWDVGRHDAVVVAGLFERLPPADIDWVADALFARAGRALAVSLTATAAEGLGSATWWRRRMSEAAARHPGVSWHLDAVPDGKFAAPGTASFEVRRAADPGLPRVWVLTGDGETSDRQAVELARALGWPFEAKGLAFNGLQHLPNRILGASLKSLDQKGSDRLEAPWPDLVISAGRRTVPVAAWIRARAGGRTRLVQIGRPRAAYELFDLIVTTPQWRLPIRDNVLHVAAPLAGVPAGRLEAARTRWQERLAGLPQPHVALVVGVDKGPFVLDAARAGELGRQVSALAAEKGGSVLLLTRPKTPAAAREALIAALAVPHHAVQAAPGEGDDAQAAFLALAAEVVATGDEVDALAEACLAGKPVRYVELGRWYDRLPLARPVLGALTLLAGGGVSYRGTPHQQHAVSRLMDHLTTRGLLTLPRDLGAFHRGLRARGLARPLGEEAAPASPKALDGLELAAERVRRLMAEEPQAG